MRAQVYVWDHVEEFDGVSEGGQAYQWSLESFLGGNYVYRDVTEVEGHEDE